jgi:hypothetical protein
MGGRAALDSEAHMKSMIAILLMFTAASTAKVDLVTLPARDSVQVTIYNSADLTLVRESRSLTLKEGKNSLQFSWENTLIDPTSLSMVPLAKADKIDVAELAYPPRVQHVGIWNIASGVKGKVPVEITYLTSGLSWRAFYMGTLTEDEKAMRLQGYVVVANNSGEDYENAQTRLIVGQVHILDQIAELARQQYPYGSPIVMPSTVTAMPMNAPKRAAMGGRGGADAFDRAAGEPKSVVKEGLSEYFLYTIEGTETIPTGWSKRLQSFDVAAVPVVNLYKFQDDRYGPGVIRFLSFKNDVDHKLGTTPIPGGMLKVYRGVDKQGHLGYQGQSEFKYIPVGQEVELSLGTAQDVTVEPKLMSLVTENVRFDDDGNVKGWDEVRQWQVEIKNMREVPVNVEVKRNFGTDYWKIDNSGDHGNYEKYDKATAKYVIELGARTKKSFSYTIRTYQGSRQEESVK